MTRAHANLAPYEALVLDGVPSPPSWHVPAALGLIGALFGGALLWAHFTDLDQVRRAQAKVVPSRAIQMVQHLEGGIVKEIKVSEGDVVEANQIVAEVANPTLSSDLNDRTGRLAAETAKAARLRAEADGAHTIAFPPRLDGYPAVLRTELDLFGARRAQRGQQRQAVLEEIGRYEAGVREANTRLTGLRRSLATADEELALKIRMAQQQVIGQAEVLAARRQSEGLRTEAETTAESLPRLRRQIGEAQAKLGALDNQFRSESLSELSKAEADIASLTQTEAAAEDRVGRTAARSPVRGIVKTLAIRTPGAVIKPGDTIAEIVPLDDQLLIEARFATSDIGGIHEKLPAAVKVTAYDYNRFGVLGGHVVDVSPDALQGDRPNELYYRVRIRTDRAVVTGSDGQVLPVLPGMVCDVDVITGRRSVLAAILAPIERVADRALRETGRSGI